MKPPIRIGVVGAGGIAQIAHLPVLARTRGTQLVALCDNDRAKARALADRFEIPDVFTDIEDLIEYDEMDAVVVCTPNHLHEPHVLSALASGHHVLCERPLSLTSRGIERILSAAERSGRKVAVANNHRFRADVQALASFLRGGELGRLTGVRAGSYRLRRPIEGWRYHRVESGGGVFFDHGFPLLDLAMWLADFPDPLRVSAHFERSRGANAVEDSMLVQLMCAQGKAITVDVSWSYVGKEEKWWFDVHCSRGSAQLSPLQVVKELNGRAIEVTPTGAAARDSVLIQSYRAELAHFLAVLREETTYEPPSDQVIVHRIIEAAYKSADEAKEIRL